MIFLLYLSFPTVWGSEKSDLEGVWEAKTYLLKEGATHQVRGHIFFAAQEWTVLFFVVDGEESPRRGSAEGGSYVLSGNQLVFTHLYHLSSGQAMKGLPESPLRMTIAGGGDAPEEPCAIHIEKDQLTISFPSGNSMTFHRRP